jgi:hypothetical protein
MAHERPILWYKTALRLIEKDMHYRTKDAILELTVPNPCGIVCLSRAFDKNTTGG